MSKWLSSIKQTATNVDKDLTKQEHFYNAGGNVN
jgi:hypothetical protein